MTNSWQDIGNATALVVWGANPVENHPACAAHMNRARYPKDYFSATDPDPNVVARRNKKEADLVVIDPRKTRTALQVNPDRTGDRYIRIRPGTDIALMNGVVKYVMDTMASLTPTYSDGAAIPAATVQKYYDYLNQGNGEVETRLGIAAYTGAFYSDGQSGATMSDEAVQLNGTTTTYLAKSGVSAVVVRSAAGGGGTLYGAGADYTEVSLVNGTIARIDGGGIADGATVYVSYTYGNATSGSKSPSNCSKYTDARFLVNSAGTDYDREYFASGDYRIANFPKKAADARDAGTVYDALADHVAPYDFDTVSDICGCSPSEIMFIGDTFIKNSRCSSKVGAGPTANPSTMEYPYDAGYRAATVLYAMGMTQHTCGGQNVKSFAVLQTLLGNMGRTGGGINALRGIHNVQGSTDMGLLYGNIPAYSGNPSVQVADMLVADLDVAVPLLSKSFDNTIATSVVVYTWNGAAYVAKSSVTDFSVAVDVGGITSITALSTGTILDGETIYVGYKYKVSATVTNTKAINAFGKYMDALWGLPLSGASARTIMNGSYDDAYVAANGQLQQRGFYNMTSKWFGDMSIQGNRAKSDACYALWPKGNGNNHIQMFRDMAAGTTKAAIVWGQNPAVTEPNQGKVRAGLKNLDLLVVTDLFETETAACDRKNGSTTYLIPTCSHVEKAGSATNSGRAFQWRYQATDPKGDSHDDTQLLLMLAKALDADTTFDYSSTIYTGYTGAFAHIQKAWDDAAVTYAAGGVFDQLYLPYGYDGVSAYSTAGTTAEMADTLGSSVEGFAPLTGYVSRAVTGSEAVAELVFREMANKNTSGTIWIYVEGYDDTVATGKGTKNRLGALYTAWNVNNRAKSREREEPYGTFGYHKWGYSWLVNRRVLYNNAEVPGDQGDFFMGPDSVSRLFVCKATPAWTTGTGDSAGTAVLNYAKWYRTIHLLADQPDVTMPAAARYNASSPHFVSPGKTYAGRFVSHVEPYESPREDLVATWGQNTKGTAQGDLVLAGTLRGTVADYPLVLTTIRCVEHFQGGPITRNNWWNVAAEPEPWIELNSVDALNAVPPIKDGDMVKIITARTDVANTPAYVGSEIDAVYPAAAYGLGFRARVGVGQAQNQRVAQGVVAIPWHWGDRGLSTGSRANDLCIDAMDANTAIPEYKACLCKIEKM